MLFVLDEDHLERLPNILARQRLEDRSLRHDLWPPSSKSETTMTPTTAPVIPSAIAACLYFRWLLDSAAATPRPM